MVYPKETIDEVPAHLDKGYSARDTERCFGVRNEGAAGSAAASVFC